MVITTPVKKACFFSAKHAYALVHARICNSAENSLPWKLLRTFSESCLGIVQAVVCHLFLLSILPSRPNPSPDTVHSRNLCDEQGTHLAEGDAKDTEYVRATVFPARVASSKHVSPLATVRSLGLFSTIAKGRISLVADVECLSLCTQWRCQEKNNPSDAPHGSAQGKTGRIRAYLWELTDGGQATE